MISTAQIGYREPDFDKHPEEANLRAIGKEMQKARQISENGIIGYNIMTALKGYADHVKAAVKAGADLIISGAGLPVDLPALTEGSAGENCVPLYPQQRYSATWSMTCK